MDDADFDWEMVVESQTDTAIQAVVSADLAVHAVIKGVYARQTVPLPSEANLPDPGKSQIVLYMQSMKDPVQAALHDMIRESYMSEWANAATKLRSV